MAMFIALVTNRSIIYVGLGVERGQQRYSLYLLWSILERELSLFFFYSIALLLLSSDKNLLLRTFFRNKFSKCGQFGISNCWIGWERWMSASGNNKMLHVEYVKKGSDQVWGDFVCKLKSRFI